MAEIESLQAALVKGLEALQNHQQNSFERCAPSLHDHTDLFQHSAAMQVVDYLVPAIVAALDSLRTRGELLC